MGGIQSFSSGGAVYRISRCIGRGGMGEVYLGLQEGIGGLERLVVIKKIYPQFCEDEHFTRMLLEEARLAASIRHPNVVQILDIGRDADGYFIAMEYLSGETTVYIKRSLRARGEAVPPAIACRIAAEVAAGLHCAHTATDPAGKPQPIVHRDVTPSNLIVCFNGVVKIVDFGVAKATMHEGQTRGGVKGKMCYLAPEQLHDQPIDGRTDVFQLGICLHELLTGDRLFKGASDQQRAMAVLEQHIAPPSEQVQGLPRVIDDVVLWALERDPARRPATADELRSALEAAAAEIGPVSSHDLDRWMRAALADRLAERTRFERQCVAEMRKERSASQDAFPAVTASGESAGMRPLPVSGRVPSLSPPPSEGGDSAGPSPRASPDSHAPRSGSRSHAPGAPRARWTIAGLIGLGVLLAAGISIGWLMDGASSESAGEAPGARAEVTEALRGGGAAPSPGSRPSGGQATTAEAASAGPVQAAPGPSPPSRSFDVAVEVAPTDAVIELDGVEVGRGSYRATLPVDGRPHIMTVRADGHEEVALDFTDQPPPPRVVLDQVRATRAKAVRSAPRPTAPAGARRGERRRARDEDEAPLTDNPDPWADDTAGSR
jgi:eukaryotic-like serine/threonine-protein kinase